MIRVYKDPTWPTYLVRLDDDSMLEMNNRPTAPNGVNMYVGNWDEWENHCEGKELQKHEIPEVIMTAAMRR
jgi:hypothetical protein